MRRRKEGMDCEKKKATWDEYCDICRDDECDRWEEVCDICKRKIEPGGYDVVRDNFRRKVYHEHCRRPWWKEGGKVAEEYENWFYHDE